MAGPPGTVKRVDDRYELRQTIGRGGFGVVWRAHDTLLRRDVAVKEIRFPGVLDEDERAQVRERVLREARTAARLNHPGAVTVYDVVDDDGQPYIVMELVEAPTLSELVERQGPLDPGRVAAIAVELLDTLCAAHSLGIVHRDVKPANVMVAGTGRVRLADFGIAAILDDPKVTTSGAITGSPSYMAPEQVNNQVTGPATDMWSLGATMYFGVEGEPPFSKGAVIPTLTSIATDPPRPARRAGALGPVLDGLLVKDPAGRLDCDTLRRMLADVAESATPVVVAAPATATTARPDDTVVLETAVAPAAAVPERASAPAPARRPEPEPAPARPPVRRTAGPATPAGTDRRVAGGLALVCVVAVLGLAAWGLSTRDPAPTASPATDEQPATTTPTAAGAPASTNPPTTRRGTAPTTAAASAPAPARPAAVPADWVAYTDPDTGFAISHPPAWVVVPSGGTTTDFRDRASGAYLRVDHVEPPGPSPEGAWLDFEPRFAAENPNYRRIQITPTTYAGFRAALWEFTYTGAGTELHAADLGFVTPRYGFALNFQTRAEDWQRMQPVFEAFKAAFKAPAA